MPYCFSLNTYDKLSSNKQRKSQGESNKMSVPTDDMKKCKKIKEMN